MYGTVLRSEVVQIFTEACYDLIKSFFTVFTDARDEYTIAQPHGGSTVFNGKSRPE